MRILITEEQFRIITEQNKVCDIFKDRTTAPDYDDILNDVRRVKQDVVGQVVQMTPDEYMDRCAQLQNTTLEGQYGFVRNLQVKNILKTINSGEKINLPYIDYESKNQEGRHRIVAAKKYGCKLVNVAIFLGKKQKDPYYDGWDEEESHFGLDTKLGEWSDVKKDHSGIFVEYNVSNFKELKLFLGLYSDFEETYDLFSSIIYGNKLEKVDDIGLQYDEFMLSQEIPELSKFIMTSIMETVTKEELIELYDEEMADDEYDENNDFYESYSLLKIVKDELGRLGDLYDYIYNMTNSVLSYTFKLENSGHFEEVYGDEYDVIIDGTIIRVYSRDTYDNLDDVRSGKELFYNNEIKLNDESPKLDDRNGHYVISSKIISMYVKRYPFK